MLQVNHDASSVVSVQIGDCRHADDFRLARLLVSGDPFAEARFVKTHTSWMLRTAQRFVNDLASAEDVVQDAFANAFRALPRFEGRSSLKTWLYRITVNAALMRVRKTKHLAECDLSENVPQFDSEQYRATAPTSQIETPHDIIARNEQRAQVSDAISRLPETYRIIIQYRDIEERDTAEVAELLGLTRNNVKIRLHRARHALKRILEPVLAA